MLRRLLLACAVLLALCGTAQAQIAYVGSTSGDNYSGSTTTTPAASAFSVSTGHAIIVGIRYVRTAAEAVSSCSDTASNTYQSAGASVNDGFDTILELWYALGVTANASNVVTCTMSAAVAYWGVVAADYSGIATTSAFDQAATGVENSGGVTVTSGSFTTTQADELIVGVAQTNILDATWSTGTGLSTIRVQGTSNITMLADAIVSTIQTGATATMSNSASNAKTLAVATFKAAAVTPSSPQSLLLLGVGN